MTMGTQLWNEKSICEAASVADEAFEELIQELLPVKKEGNNLEMGYIIKVIEIV